VCRGCSLIAGDGASFVFTALWLLVQHRCA
jgi:hypothetical protein